jgi:hypothetical protein
VLGREQKGMAASACIAIALNRTAAVAKAVRRFVRIAAPSSTKNRDCCSKKTVARIVIVRAIIS